jgi:hypothetical protein
VNWFSGSFVHQENQKMKEDSNNSSDRHHLPSSFGGDGIRPRVAASSSNNNTTSATDFVELRKRIAACLWGDVWFDKDTRNFKRTPPAVSDGSVPKRSFIEFVLEPIYKICAHTLSEDQKSLTPTLKEVKKNCLLKYFFYLRSVLTLLAKIVIWIHFHFYKKSYEHFSSHHHRHP